MDKKGVMMEEWKARRRVEEKEVEKREKVALGNVLFVFV